MLKTASSKPLELPEEIQKARDEHVRLQLLTKELEIKNGKLSEEIVLLGEEVNSLRVRAGKV